MWSLLTNSSDSILTQRLLLRSQLFSKYLDGACVYLACFFLIFLPSL